MDDRDAEIIVTHLDGSTLAGTEQRYRKRRLMIGRRSTNDIRYDKNRDLAVSGYHAELFIAEGRLYVHDVGSRNGTFVNDRPITEDRRLEPEDVITLGVPGAKLRARLETPQESEPTTADSDKSRKSVGMSTLGHVIDSVVRKERSRGRRLIAAVAVATFLLCVGGAAMFRMHQHKVKSEQEAIRIASARQQEELAATKREISQAEKRLSERLADAETVFQAVRDENERRLRQSLAGLEQQIGAIQGKLSQDEEKISRLMAELQARDESLARIYENQQFDAEEKARLVAETRREIRTLQRQLEQTQELARESGTQRKTWSDLADQYSRSVFLCLGMSPESGQGTGTGFAVDDKGLIATNAHVVKTLEKHKQRFVIQNETGVVFPIVRMLAHPDHSEVRSPDVGLIQIDPGDERFTPFKLADKETLKRLRIGTNLGTLGFPGELSSAYLRDFHPSKRRVRTVQATFKDGWIGRITNYRFENDDAPFTRYIQHSASLSPGTSGSPMFNENGEVVAVNAGAIVFEMETTVVLDGQTKVKKVTNPSASQIAFAIRIDELLPLLEEFDR